MKFTKDVIYLKKNVNFRLNVLLNETQKYNAIPLFITQGTKRWIKKNNLYYGLISENKKTEMLEESLKSNIRLGNITYSSSWDRF